MSIKALSSLNFILMCAGFSYLHRGQENLRNLKYVWQIVNFVPTLLLIFGGIYFMSDSKMILTEFAESITINVICYLMIVEEICLFTYRDDIKEMVDCFILNDYEIRIPLVAYIAREGVMGPKTGKLLNAMDRTRTRLLRIFTICMILMSAACFGSGALFCSSPVILGISQPDNYYRKLLYVGIDCLIALVVGQIIRQIIIVRFIMSNLEELADETSGRSSQQWEMHCDIMLANCVAHYVHLKRRENINVSRHTT